MATAAKKKQQEKKERIKFTGLEVENFQRITLARLEFSGKPGVIEITGGNKQGKTSLRDAGVALLGGRGMIREDPRKDDADGPTRVLGTLNNGFKILLRPTANNPKGNLVIEGPDHGKYNQTFLNAWVGEGTFDLGGLREYQAKPEKLVPILLSLGKDPGLATELEDIHSERETLENQRSPWISGKQRAERSKRPEGDRPEPVDVSGSMEKLKGFEAAIQEREDLDRAFANAEIAVEVAGEKLMDLRAALITAEESFNEKKEVMQERHEALTQSVDYSTDAEELRVEIAQADGRNQALEPWKEWDRAQAEIEESRGKIEGFNQDLEHLRKAERTLLKEKGPDLPGLTFSDEGLPLLWDRVIGDASGREWLEFSAAVAFAHDPELGVAFFDEAEGVDDEGLRDLHELGQEWDFQLFLYKIRASGVGEVVVCEDGRAWNREPEDGKAKG